MPTMTFLGFNVTDWAAIATILTLLTTVGGLVIIILTLRATKSQLDEMSRARSLTAFLEVHKLLEDLEEKNLRRSIYELVGEPGDLVEADQNKFEQLIRNVDTIAYLVERNYVALDDFLGLYFTVIVKLRRKTKPYVIFERQKRKNADWASHFEWLADKAEAYLLNQHPNIEVDLIRKEIDDIED